MPLASDLVVPPAPEAGPVRSGFLSHLATRPYEPADLPRRRPQRLVEVHLILGRHRPDLTGRRSPNDLRGGGGFAMALHLGSMETHEYDRGLG